MAVHQLYQSRVRDTGELVEVYTNRGIQLSNQQDGVNVLLSFDPVLLDHGIGFKLQIGNVRSLCQQPTVRYILGATMEELREIMDRIEDPYASRFGRYELGGCTFGTSMDSWIEGIQNPGVSKAIRHGDVTLEEEPKYYIRRSLKFDDVDPEEETVFIGKQLKFGENDGEF